ncbi:hypothetical protein MMC13_001746 [Lambiella insularis]|nr:hypothetical protein [Lambiella insularis]
MRKLSSRCMGLLECHGGTDGVFKLRRFEEDSDGEIWRTTEPKDGEKNDKNLFLNATQLFQISEVLTKARSTVDFLHRSLRDFLLTPKVQCLLHHHTQGPYDARMFFRNARLVELVALNKIEVDLEAALGLASYILSTLTVPGFRNAPCVTAVTTIMRPVMEDLVRFDCTESISGWYVCLVLLSWHEEGSTFLTLAIDFGLDAYVLSHLTSQCVKTKKGRPVLDYILRTRFARDRKTMCVGKQMPNSAFLTAALRVGADPNQCPEGVSVWALFLCFVAGYLEREQLDTTLIENRAYLEALKIMLQNGADVLLPGKWLSTTILKPGMWFSRTAYVDPYGLAHRRHEATNQRLRQRFPNAMPRIQGSTNEDTFYAVSDLLEHFCDLFRSLIDIAKSLAMQREAEILAPASSGQMVSSKPHMTTDDGRMWERQAV